MDKDNIMDQILVKTPFITLVGPPNSGKTTLFNFLSGKNYKTVNYPGSTVDYSVSSFESKFKLNGNLLDSPGIISLVPNSLDEKVAVDSIYEHPEFGVSDLIIATCDASQISRHLLLTKQLKDSNFNVILVITMNDILHKKGYDISAHHLAEEIGCPVIKFDGRTGNGIDELIKTINYKVSLLPEVPRQPHPYELNSKTNLIAIYDEIEEIVKKSRYKLPSEQIVKKASQELKIFSNKSAKVDCNKIDATTLKLDKVLLHKYWGLFFFFLFMSFIFTSIYWLAQPMMDFIDTSFGYLAEKATEYLGYGWFGDLISTGIISGTGSVLVFIPQIIILFLILGFLEDTGYLARGAMLIDKPLSKIGLNGRSFVPMLSGFACAIPAIMAARTIPNKKERLLTIMIIPLMSCSARLPVYALLIGFLIPVDNQLMGGMILAGIYMFGIFSSALISSIINKFRLKFFNDEDNSSFILELPTYRRPKLSVVLLNTYHNAKHYINRAGPTILAFSLIIWFLTFFPNTDPNVDETNLTKDQVMEVKSTERLATSYASELGKFIEPVMRPLGLDWRVGVSLISAFAAREVFVSSLALIMKITEDNEDNMQSSMIKAMKEAKIDGTNEPLFTTSKVIGLIVFFIFALQCISTIAISKKETNSWKIPLFQVALYSGLAYILTFITINGLKLFGIN